MTSPALARRPAPLTEPPVLVGCSHGTNDPAGRAVVRGILDDVRALRPDLEVREAFVDVQRPEVADVVSAVVAPGDECRDAVVVPLLLSAGYHVGVDIAEAVAPRGDDAGSASAAGPLGPDPRLVDILMDRLAAAGTRPFDAVVVAAAGSSRLDAAADVAQVVAAVRRRHRGPVSVGYGAIAQPSVADAVAAARAGLGHVPHPLDAAPRVVVASYLLAPGHFHDRLLTAGADVVSAPLGPDPRLAEIVVERYGREAMFT
ncbi:hypothetical protein GCM10028820_04310 [Tessaracoccus terricola]